MGRWRPRTPPSAPSDCTPPPAYNNTMAQPVLSPKACAMIEAITRNRELGLRASGSPQVQGTASIAGVMEAVPGRILPVSPNPRCMPGTPSMEAAMLALSSPNLPEVPHPQPQSQPHPQHQPEEPAQMEIDSPANVDTSPQSPPTAAAAAARPSSSTSTSLARMRKLLQ